jgi:serine/threonine protein kinase/tetratricopeptide (TPR) repeat protein
MSLAEKEVLHCEQCGAPLESEATALGCLNCLLLGGLSETRALNRRFQHYEVCLSADGVTPQELGRGAMGTTYRAVDVNLGSHVALKVISARYSGNSDARERFRREARAAAQLRHPNVASVFHFGETPAGQCFYAMELVEGETLEARVRRDGPLPVSLALVVGEQVARALMAAETHGLVHRDLKPSNLMIVPTCGDSGDPATTGLVVKVIDFGLAKPTATTPDTVDEEGAGFSGTPGFASPEQLATDQATARLDARSDIYSLGVTLWYLLCGRTPFTGRTPKELREEQFHELPGKFSALATSKVPTPLIRLLRSMLATDPAERPQSARELLAQLRRCRDATEARPRRSRLLQLAALALLVSSGVGLMSYFWYRQHIQQGASTATAAAPEKSVAVLPFENLSNDREDAFFADGVQDDVLTKLANIADLKVISRTSVMQYRGEHNTRQIGDALQVSHVLEGSVRKTGAWLHINAQLIDTRTDSHVWAKQYDGELKQMFTIQSEIAQKVAEQLHAKISATEKLAIERPPTADLTAFDLYSRAKNLVLEWSYHMSGKDNLPRAADLLNQALAHDPTFFQAHCQLASIHDQLYTFGFDRTPGRLELADAAVQAAFRIHPDAGEAHLARAGHLYRAYRDFDGALAELETAGKTLPNDARLFELKGYIERRRPGGNQEEVVRDFERAIDLDPRNFLILQQTSLTYDNLRRFREEKLVFDRMLAIKPNDAETKVDRAFVELDWKADTRPLRQMIDSMRVRNPATMASIAGSWLACALAERDPAAAKDALIALGDTPLNDDVVQFSRPFLQGLIARMMHDDEQARSAFSAARAEQEKIVEGHPDYGPPLCVLGLIDAALGRKEEALREGKRAVDLLPVEKDALSGTAMITYLAMIAAWAGDKDGACEQLATASSRPGSVSYGKLKLMPFWDPLRGDPRFEKIVASLAPK